MQLFGRTRENECRQELLSAGRELLSPSAEGEREEGFLLAGAERLSPCPRKEVEERKESFSGEFSLLRPKKEVDKSQEEGEKEVSLSWHREVGNRMVQLENYKAKLWEYSAKSRTRMGSQILPQVHLRSSPHTLVIRKHLRDLSYLGHVSHGTRCPVFELT